MATPADRIHAKTRREAVSASAQLCIVQIDPKATSQKCANGAETQQGQDPPLQTLLQ